MSILITGILVERTLFFWTISIITGSSSIVSEPNLIVHDKT